MHSQKIKGLLQYYRNTDRNEKSHLITMLNKKLRLVEEPRSKLEDRFISMLTQGNRIDENLLKSTYTLYYVESAQLRYRLQDILNAQLSIMYRLKYCILLLKFNHELPFDMDPEFLCRFTETSSMSEDQF